MLMDMHVRILFSISIYTPTQNSNIFLQNNLSVLQVIWDTKQLKYITQNHFKLIWALMLE